MTGKFNALLRTFVSLSVIGASVVFGTTPAAAAVTCSQRSLNVVAHEDDDLLFMNPDIQHDISAGVCVTTVVLTAGDDGQGIDYWLEREVGSQSAYGTMLGAPSTWTTWQRSFAGHFAGHSVHTMTSSGGAIDLIYLRLPDGDGSGTGFSATGRQSLSQLYSGSISSIRAVDGSATYSRNNLIATIAAIVSATGPSVVRVQDGRSDQGDHSDHQMAALFTLEALVGYTGTVTAYRGYGVVNDPANVSGNDLILKTSVLLSYAAHDPLLCSDLSNCPQGVVSKWSERRYTAPLPFSLTPVPGPAPYSGPNVMVLSHQTGARLAEVGFLLIVFAGIWLAASEFKFFTWGAARKVVAGVALALAGVLLIIATHWGSFG